MDLFTQFGVPEVVVMDNGSYFVSGEFETFLLKNGIKHITSAAYHPSSKNVLGKEGRMKTKLARVMKAYRVSPQSTTGESPVLLFQKHQIHTRLDLLKPGRNERVEICWQKQKAEHDASARQTTFSQGEVVYAHNFGTVSRWLPGVIQEISGPVLYLVKLTDSHLVRRHQDHIRC